MNSVSAKHIDDDGVLRLRFWGDMCITVFLDHDFAKLFIYKIFWITISKRFMNVTFPLIYDDDDTLEV